MNATTATGHILEIVTLLGFLFCFAIPVYLEYRKKAVAPRPKGATKL